MPTAEYTAATRDLAVLLKAALPATWTIIALDVDGWRYDGGDRDHRRLVLSGTGARAGDRRRSDVDP